MNQNENPTPNGLAAKQVEEAGMVKHLNYHREATEKTSLPGSAVMRFVGRVSDI